MQNTPPVLHPSLQAALLAALCVCSSPLPAQNPAQDSAAPTSTIEHLSGLVVNSTDGKPVARVLVTSPDRRMAVLTDFQGRFSFEYRRPILAPSRENFGGLSSPYFLRGPTTMPIQFMVRKPGFVTGTVTLRLPAASPDTPTPPLQLKIVPAAVLSGHVDPEAGDPPAGMTVQLRHRQIQDGAATWAQANSARVNSRGEFRFPNLQPGDYKIMTASWTAPEANRSPPPDSSPGLLPAFYPGGDNLDVATPIHVAPGETVTANLAPRSATFYHVEVPVTGIDPTKGFNATLLPGDSTFPVRVNMQNHAVEAYLPTGSYTIRIGSFGGPSPVTAIAHLQVNGAPVHMPAVAPLAGADLPILVHRDFTGDSANLQNMEGPSVNIGLQPVDSSGTAVGSAPQQPGEGDESLRLQNVSEGRYRVVAYPHAGYIASIASGGVDLLREPLTVGASGSAAPIEITLRDDFASLAGRVSPSDATQPQAADADPIFVQFIPLDRLEGPSWGNIVTMDRNFTMPSLAPGSYLVLASHQQMQNLEFRNRDVLDHLLTKGTVVALSAGQRANVQVPLMPEEGN